MVERRGAGQQVHHGQKYVHYDKQGQLHTLLGKCVFCRFAAGKIPEALLYEVQSILDNYM